MRRRSRGWSYVQQWRHPVVVNTIIPPVIDKHRQHHAVGLGVVWSGASFRTPQQGRQRFHQSILEFSALVTVYNQGHTKYDVVNQQVRHRVGALILHGEGLCPLTEVVSDHQDVAESLRCRGHRRPEYPWQYGPSDDRWGYFLKGGGGPPGTSS